MKKLNKVSVVLASVAAFITGSAQAAFDTAPVVTAVTEAETSGLSVGTSVVAAVAAFVVVSVIIGMVRKL